MKAVTLGAPGGLDHLQLVDMREPEGPAAGEIRVRLHASSLNFHDYAVVRGLRPAADGRIPMSDGAGVVEAVGAGVTELAVGDSVVSGFFPLWHDGPPVIADFSQTPGDGLDGYARELVVTPASWFTKAPKGFSHAEAATLTTAGLTAWRALVVECRVKAGDTVLVLGTGGVSIFALQLAKLMGATVIATSSADQKLERVRALGADHTVNYKADPEWGNTVRRLTGGHGVDHVVEGSRDAAAIDSGGAYRRTHCIDRYADPAEGRPAAVAHDDQAGPAAGPGRRQPPPATGDGPGHRDHRAAACH